MKKLRLQYNKKGIFKVTCYMLLVFSVINLINVPKTNAYFKKVETRALEASSNLYKVNEVKMEVTGINAMTVNSFVANITFTRNDSDIKDKQYRITCGNKVTSLTLKNGNFYTGINCGISADNTSEKVSLKIEEMIYDEHNTKIPFLCGENIINYKGYGNFTNSLIQLLTENKAIESIWTRKLTPEDYLYFNRLSNDSLISKSTVTNIGVFMNENNEFSEDTNFVGYVKTYEYYKSIYPTLTENKNYRMYFTTNETAIDSSTNTKLEKALKIYLEKYIYSTSDEATKVYNYIINQNVELSQVIDGNDEISGITKEGDYLVIDKEIIAEALKEYEQEIEKYEKFLTQMEEYKDEYANTTEYISSLPQNNGNPFYKAVVDGPIKPQYFVYYDYNKENNEQYLSLIEISKANNNPKIDITQLEKEAFNNILESIGTSDNMYLHLYATLEEYLDLQQSFETFLGNDYGTIKPETSYEDDYVLLSYEIKGISTINKIEEPADDENKEEEPLPEPELTFEDYKKFLTEIDTEENIYSKDYKKSYAFISEETENNIFYQSYISKTPKLINYIYYEVVEDETLENNQIVLSLITMDIKTIDEETTPTISIMNLTEDRLTNLLDKDLKVHYSNEDDKELLINAINKMLNFNPNSEENINNPEYIPEYIIEDDTNGTITYKLNNTTTEKPTTPPTEEDKKDEGEESTDNTGEKTEENNPDNPTSNDKEQPTDSKTPTDKDEGTITPSEDNNTGDSSQNDLGGNSNEATSLDNAPVESAPEVPASSNSATDSAPNIISNNALTTVNNLN